MCGQSKFSFLNHRLSNVESMCGGGCSCCIGKLNNFPLCDLLVDNLLVVPDVSTALCVDSAAFVIAFCMLKDGVWKSIVERLKKADTRLFGIADQALCSCLMKRVLAVPIAIRKIAGRH